MSTEEQKRIADKVYEKLQAFDPYCVLARGAPRDWYFDKEVTDLDFYFYTHANTLGATSSLLDRQFGKGVFEAKCNNASEMYKHMKNIRRIWDGVVEGMSVQLIQLTNDRDLFKIGSMFSTSICDVTYYGGKIKTSQDFKISLGSGVVFVREGYNWSDPHPSKIMRKAENKDFGRGVSVGSKEQAIASLVRKATENL